MITIKLVGGAKKSFQKNEIFLDTDSILLQELLECVVSMKPSDTIDLDITNILVAINGVDSSALSGKSTIIQEGDVVSIIPIIHGGSPKRLDFVISNYKIILMEINDFSLDSKYLDSLRLKFPKLIIQAISNNFILGRTHFIKILKISLEAQKNNILLSEKLESDILLRFAATTQISKAINDLGIKKGQGFFLICIGNKSDLESIHSEVLPKLSTIFSKKNDKYLKNYFKISKTHIDSVLSKTPLEDILTEKSTSLF